MEKMQPLEVRFWRRFRFWSRLGYGGDQNETNFVTENDNITQRNLDNNFTLAFDGVVQAIDEWSKGANKNANKVDAKIDYRDVHSFWICVKILLVNDSMLDIGDRCEVYQSLLQVLKSMSSPNPISQNFLTMLPAGEERSLFDLLEALSKHCTTLLALCSDAKNERSNKMGKIDDVNQIARDVVLVFEQISSKLSTSSSASSSASVAAASASARVNESSSSGASGSGRKKRQRDSNISATVTPVVVEQQTGEQKYVAALRPMRFEAISLCDKVTSGAVSHIFADAAFLDSSSGHKGVTGDARKRLMRIATEMADLQTSLPVEFGSSVFVRCDESRMDVLKALIVGPDDTPYASGCFEFDILLPPAYPSVPPQVNMVTTGGGTVSFNPNLYEDGYVCLSLLGTWDGPGWIPEKSTLLQVLVSIQSLIFVPQPFYNEPGFEAADEDPHFQEQSREYNCDIRKKTLHHAILAQLNKPSRVFKDIIETHFFHKRNALLKQLRRWRELASMEEENGDSALPTVKALAQDIEAALRKLVMRVDPAVVVLDTPPREVINLLGDAAAQLPPSSSAGNKKQKRVSGAKGSGESKDDCILLD